MLIMKLWDFILPFLCWGVCKEINYRVFRGKETNDRMFRGKEINSIQLFYRIKYLMIENIRTAGIRHQPQTD